MKTYSTTVKRPINAGMHFTYPQTKNNKISIVGYKWIKLIYDSPAKDCLINEIEIKRDFI